MSIEKNVDAQLNWEDSSKNYSACTQFSASINKNKFFQHLNAIRLWEVQKWTTRFCALNLRCMSKLEINSSAKDIFKSRIISIKINSHPLRRTIWLCSRPTLVSNMKHLRGMIKQHKVISPRRRVQGRQKYRPLIRISQELIIIKDPISLLNNRKNKNV